MHKGLVENLKRRKYRQKGMSYIEMWKSVQEKNKEQLTRGRNCLIIHYDSMALSLPVRAFGAVNRLGKGCGESCG